MKRIIIYAALLQLFIISGTAYAQVLNWKSLLKEQKHILSLHAGAENGLVMGAGYAYQLKTGLPLVLNMEYSFPAGKNLADDFKTKIGGSMRLYQLKDFQFSARIQGIFRRYENPFSRLVNFGSDLAGVIGYYKPKWFIAGETGFDKAIVTHFRHSELYKQNFPMVKDGWYEPATGGNFYYGLQAGYSFKANDIYLKAGKMVEQDFSADPLLPYYLQVGFNMKLK